MNNNLVILTEEEVRNCRPVGEEAGLGALETARGLLPLRALDVHTRVDGLAAQTTLAQTFVNVFGEPLEATYVFPLPDRAAVTRFRLEVAGRVIEGVLKERSEARRDYDEAIQAGRRAGITEEERPGVFTLRVGNLMPGEEATVRLTLSGPLTYDDGEATFRFPLVVAPRYIPGTPLPGPSTGDGVAPDTDAVPDASRITPPVLLPGFPNPVRLALSVELHAAGMPVADVRSSLHAVAVQQSEGAWHITLQPEERLNRDFILRFRVGDQAVRTGLTLHPDADGEEGTFLLTVVPPAGQARAPRPRDVIFVLDRSGSMGGWKMVAARRALGRMVDTLTERDRFTVYAFDDKVETPATFQGEGLVAATDRNRFRAVEFLAGIDARNGTEMARPLQQAVGRLTAESPERDRILVLVTDGQVGNEDQILRTLTKGLAELRVFALGIDQAVNAAFLKRLAALGGGSCELVESEDRLDEVMDKVHRRIGTPVLTGLRLEAAGLQIDRTSIVPARLPDLFAGAPLFLTGRYRGRAGEAVTLQAQDAAARPWSETVRTAVSDNSAITSLWAGGYVRELEDRYITRHEDRSALEKQIVQTSLRFGVLCRFTAFVAVDVKEVVNASGQLHRVTQPVEPAAGWAMLGTTDYDAQSATLFALYRSPRISVAPSAQPAGAQKMKRRKGGLVEGLKEAFVRLSSPTPASTAPPTRATTEPVDLTAYRRRALELLQVLQSAAGPSAAARLIAFGVLAVQLAALIEDLQSIGVASAEIHSLEELLQELRCLLATQPPRETEIDLLWSRAAAVLQGFGQGAGALAPGGRRADFWK